MPESSTPCVYVNGEGMRLTGGNTKRCKQLLGSKTRVPGYCTCPIGFELSPVHETSCDMDTLTIRRGNSIATAFDYHVQCSNRHPRARPGCPVTAFNSAYNGSSSPACDASPWLSDGLGPDFNPCPPTTVTCLTESMCLRVSITSSSTALARQDCFPSAPTNTRRSH